MDSETLIINTVSGVILTINTCPHCQWTEDNRYNVLTSETRNTNKQNRSREAPIINAFNERNFVIAK